MLHKARELCGDTLGPSRDSCRSPGLGMRSTVVSLFEILTPKFPYRKRLMKPRSLISAFALVIMVASLSSLAQAQQYKYETPIPPGITTPDKVDTRLGTLKFEGGYPDAATVEKVYDNLDFLRGVDVFLNSIQGASLVALRRGSDRPGVSFESKSQCRASEERRRLLRPLFWSEGASRKREQLDPDGSGQKVVRMPAPLRPVGTVV